MTVSILERKRERERERERERVKRERTSERERKRGNERERASERERERERASDSTGTQFPVTPMLLSCVLSHIFPFLWNTALPNLLSPPACFCALKETLSYKQRMCLAGKGGAGANSDDEDARSVLSTHVNKPLPTESVVVALLFMADYCMQNNNWVKCEECV